MATATLILTTRAQRRNHLLTGSPAPLPTSRCSPCTYVEISLHSRVLFSQNEPNSRNDKTNITSCAAKHYANKPPRLNSKKRTQSNPNEPNLSKHEMTLNLCLEKHYGEMFPLRRRQNKPNQTQFPRPGPNPETAFLSRYRTLRAPRIENFFIFLANN